MPGNYPPNVAGVASVVSGQGVVVNNADPANPVVGITAPVSASNGGTGLVTSGTNPLKYLKSDGAGGWELETPAGGGTLTAVTASSPIVSSGGTTPNISHATSGVVANTYTNATVSVDATGHVTSASSGTAPVTSVAGSSPISSSGGTTPSLSLDANGVTPAYLSRGASGSVIVGQGVSADSAYTTISGDATLANTGVATVTGLQGRTMSSTAPSSNQVVKWSGSTWEPGTVAAGELSGTLPLANNSTALAAAVALVDNVSLSFVLDSGAAQSVTLANASTTIAVSTSLASGLATTSALYIAASSGTVGNITGINQWIGSKPTFPVTVGTDIYLLVVSTFDAPLGTKKLVGSWQKLTAN